MDLIHVLILYDALLHEAPVEQISGLLGSEGDAVQLVQLVLGDKTGAISLKY